MGTELARYDAACRAVSECRRIDEAKDIRDRAVAMTAYARQAKNKDLEADAIEIRMRATRRLDQLRQAQKETVGLAKNRFSGLSDNPLPTLASQGIDKNLAHQARRLGELSDEEFEERVSEAREAAQTLSRRATGQDDNKDIFLMRAAQARDFAEACGDLVSGLDADALTEHSPQLASAARAAAEAWSTLAHHLETKP